MLAHDPGGHAATLEQFLLCLGKNFHVAEMNIHHLSNVICDGTAGRFGQSGSPGITQAGQQTTCFVAASPLSGRLCCIATTVKKGSCSTGGEDGPAG